MSIIKIADISHVRFSAPDLGEMQRYLEAFGLKPAFGDDGALYARGAGTSPFLHVTTLGEPAFTGIGLRANTVADLERLAAAEGVAVENFAGPGGGKILRLRDPDGTTVEVIAGQTPVERLPTEADALRNTAAIRPRKRFPVRLKPGPATVVRIGHAVLNVSDFRKLEAWYKERFGFITSDEIEAAPGHAIGAFLRCDRGDEPTDHHTLFLLQAPSGPGFNHAAFEVMNFDDLMRGHTHLKNLRQKSAWGVGRHFLGSQVFDYWMDPWGHELEHWTDGDLFTAADGSNVATMNELLGVQWGPLHPLVAAAQTAAQAAAQGAQS